VFLCRCARGVFSHVLYTYTHTYHLTSFLLYTNLAPSGSLVLQDRSSTGQRPRPVALHFAGSGSPATVPGVGTFIYAISCPIGRVMSLFGGLHF
jgi:hypothetical protein